MKPGPFPDYDFIIMGNKSEAGLPEIVALILIYQDTPNMVLARCKGK